MQGMRESLLENLVLQNISLRVTQAFDYSQRASMRAVPAIRTTTASRCMRASLRTARWRTCGIWWWTICKWRPPPACLEAYPRTALSVFNAEGALLKSIGRTPGGRLWPGRGIARRPPQPDYRLPGGPGDGNVSADVGMADEDVALEANNLRPAKRPWERS